MYAQKTLGNVDENLIDFNLYQLSAPSQYKTQSLVVPNSDVSDILGDIASEAVFFQALQLLGNPVMSYRKYCENQTFMNLTSFNKSLSINQLTFTIRDFNGRNPALVNTTQELDLAVFDYRPYTLKFSLIYRR